MADASKRLPNNASGSWFVDWSCIYCGLCVEYAPSIFAEDPVKGAAFVIKQPETPAEMQSAKEALNDCPLESIGCIESTAVV
jgi:ferredoxin